MKTRVAHDALAVGIVGRWAAPSALVLGQYLGGELRPIGITQLLSPTLRADFAALAEPEPTGP